MKHLLTLGIVCATLAIAAIAHAVPTLIGPTGLVAVPTAAVVPAGTLDVAADYYATNDDTYGAEDTIPIRLVYGISPNWELGGTYIASKDQNSWNLNAKYRSPISVAGFDLAAGALYNSNENDLAGETITSTLLYLAADRVIIEGGETGTTTKLTLGVNYLNEEGDSWKESGFRVNGGVQMDFANKMSLALEAQTANKHLDASPITSVVARYPFTPNLTGQIGYTNAGDYLWWWDGTPVTGGQDHNFFAGLSYRFASGDSE